MEYEDFFWVIIFIFVYFAIILSVLIKLFIVNLRETSWKKQKPSWKWIFFAYFILAFGDMAHLGLRVVIYFSGIDQTGIFADFLLGLGYIASGVTMTYFYIAVLHALIDIYGDRYSASYNKKFTIIAYAGFILRIALISAPYNHWFDGIGMDVSAVDFGFDFRILSAVPIFIVGIAAIIYLYKAVNNEISNPTGIAPEINAGMSGAARWYIASYICYGIAVFFIAAYPAVGFLYIPKTIAYLMALYWHYKTLLNKRVK